MKRARRFFSPEFKAEAVRLIQERGYSVSQACRELDIGETALRRWISQVEAENQGYLTRQQTDFPRTTAHLRVGKLKKIWDITTKNELNLI